MTKDEALKLALEALEMVVVDVKTTPTAYEAHRQAITAIKQALAAPVQEPVAWMSTHDVGFRKSEFGATPTVPLYTQPQRTWVGLTHDEFKQIMLATYNIDLNVPGHSLDDYLLWNAIEAKLKEKNA
jgi:pyruvate/2-oxoglutarate dehydrogenase complex dihydrolipoamide dehydrogenase (E3) component